jgi:plastocyanin
VFKRFGRFMSIALVSLVVLAACGGDDDSNGNGGNGGNGDSDIDMEMGEMYFDPDSVSADAGTSLTINFDNVGNQLHDFTIDDLNGEEVEIDVPSGEQDSLTLQMPDEPGEYTFYCDIPGHREAGMEGTLTVN